MNFDFTTLIADRSATDVERVRALSRKSVGAMSGEELEEFLSNMRGAYNASDLNRVENAVGYLAEFLRSIPEEVRSHAEQSGVAWDALFETPYDPEQIVLTVKTDWGTLDAPVSGDLERYLGNVVLLRASLPLETATLPESMENLTWVGANAIEQVLFDLAEASENLRKELKAKIDRTISAAVRSGELFSGEV